MRRTTHLPVSEPASSFLSNDLLLCCTACCLPPSTSLSLMISCSMDNRVVCSPVTRSYHLPFLKCGVLTLVLFSLPLSLSLFLSFTGFISISSPQAKGDKLHLLVSKNCTKKYMGRNNRRYSLIQLILTQIFFFFSL